MRLLVASVVIVLAAGLAEGQGSAPAPASAPAGQVILTERHFWRKHYMFQPPVVAEPPAAPASADAAATASASAPKPAPAPRLDSIYQSRWLAGGPPGDWAAADFDDSRWLLYRGREFVTGDGRLIPGDNPEATSPHLRGGDPGIEKAGLICLRGKFVVSDPAKVRSLALSLTYRGGFVAYLNGHEVARQHLGTPLAENGERGPLPAGELKPTTPAEVYPLDAWVYQEGKDKGKYLHAFDAKAPWEKRERVARIDLGPAPLKHLRQGVNVLALEFHRSAYPAAWRSWKNEAGWQRSVGMAGLSVLELRADADDGAVADGGPHVGPLAAWPVDIAQPISALARPNIDQKLAPIRLAGCRNGTFSGMLMVSDDKPFQAPATQTAATAPAWQPAVASALAAPGGAAIPAGAVTIRYAAPNPFWPGGVGFASGVIPIEHRPDKGAGFGPRLDMLLPQAPETSSLLAVWVSVRVPKDAPAGLYKGPLTVSLPGERTINAEIELAVADWTLPDVKDSVSLMNIYQSPETLALWYGVKSWSDEHWRLIERSMELMGRAGNIGLFIPLLAQSQRGNADSYVKWIKKDGGGPQPQSIAVGVPGYDYDFAIMDRYLDVALKHHPMERIRFVCLVAWGYEGDKKPAVKVSVAGQEELLTLPAYNDPACEALLKPLLDATMARLKQRGLAEKVLVGMAWDTPPQPHAAALFRRLLPEAGWLTESHMRQWTYAYDVADPKKKFVPVKYNSVVWGGEIPDPTEKRFHGWQYGPDRLTMNFNRVGVDSLSLTGFAEPWCFRMWMESTHACGRNGVGNVGGDYWPIVNWMNQQGKVPAGGSGAYWNGSGTLYGVYPVSNVGRTGVGNNTTDLFAPGPQGPVPTIRFENALENNQECEARAFVEKALLDKAAPLGSELARRCQAALDERTHVVRLWSMGAAGVAPYGWQERSAELYRLAGEVAKARPAQAGK